MSLSMLQLIASQRALLDALEAQVREQKIPQQQKEKALPEHPQEMTPEQEAYYADFVEQERQELLRQAAKSHQIIEEAREEAFEAEEEALESEPIILPHLLDKMEQTDRKIGGLDQQELMDSLNI